MASYAHSKHFTLNEARAKLPAILPFVREMTDLKRRLDDLRYDVRRHTYFGGSGPNGERVYPKELDRLVAIIRRLAEDGIEVKSIDEGLIDFPHIRSSGEEVYLCFKLGEDDIRFWHPLEGGFAARRTLDEL